MPTTPPSITALPAPPDPNDRSTYNARAYPWSVAQQTLATEVGAVATNVFDNATEAATAASTAATQAGLAATAKTNAYDAAALANNWATKTDGPVSGGEYSAKKYAQDAAATVAAIPEGTINDATTSLVSVWSSSKTSSELSGKQAALVSGTNIKTINGANILGAGDLSVATAQVFVAYEEQPNGTASAQGLMPNGTWTRRTLNTVAKNSISGASLSSNLVSLPAGEYTVQALAPLFGSGGNGEAKIRIYNVTASAVLVYGAYNKVATNTGVTQSASGAFSLSVTSEIEISQGIKTTSSHGGLAASISGAPEHYSQIIIRKELT